MAYCPMHGVVMMGYGEDLAGFELFECPEGEAWYYNPIHDAFIRDKREAEEAPEEDEGSEERPQRPQS